jgi:hypothetical protein
MSLAIVGLLIFSLAGQAAASFKMACQRTAACCCRNAPAMPAMGGDMAPMSKGCCDTSPAPTCDLAGPLSSPSIPFLPAGNTLEPALSMAPAGAIATMADAIDAGAFNRQMLRPPPLVGPPTYLRTQTFLC